MNLDLFDSAAEPEEVEGTPPPAPSVGEEAPEGLPSEPSVWTVSELNRSIRALLEDGFPPLWVSGEVANWKRAASGHRYFTLKDESSQLRCVMWRGDAVRLPMDPDEGMKIRVLGQVTIYENRGELQLVVREVQGEEGEGLWRLAFERLRKRLQEEGLLAPERKRPLPRFPQVVGVVTSLTGAALHDILTVLRRRAPWLTVLVVGTRVQGEGAAEEIATSIRRLAGSGLPEVLIVGRGGGSVEDLWAFNEEAVARAIVECPIPVVSAVGHEVDVTISDLVADLRAPTPSAAAEAVAPDKEEILRYLREAETRLARGLRRGLDGQIRRLDLARRELLREFRVLTSRQGTRVRLLHDALVREVKGVFFEGWRRLDRSRQELRRGMKAFLRLRRGLMEGLGGRMHALSPLSTLQRGFAVPLSVEGRILRETRDFIPGTEFILRIVDGKVRCEVVGKESDEVGGKVHEKR